jgi:hypothetical protein
MAKPKSFLKPNHLRKHIEKKTKPCTGQKPDFERSAAVYKYRISKRTACNSHHEEEKKPAKRRKTVLIGSQNMIHHFGRLDSPESDDAEITDDQSRDDEVTSDSQDDEKHSLPFNALEGLSEDETEDENAQVRSSRNCAMTETAVFSAANDPLTARMDGGMRIKPIDWAVMHFRENEEMVFEAIRLHLLSNYPDWTPQTRRNLQIRYDKMKVIVDENTSLIPGVWRAALLPRLGVQNANFQANGRTRSHGRLVLTAGENDEDGESSEEESMPRKGNLRATSPSTDTNDDDNTANFNGAAKFIIDSSNFRTPGEVALQNAREHLDYLRGLCNVRRHPEDWVSIITPQSQDFRYFIKLQLSNRPAGSWQRLKSTPELDNVSEANSWARSIANLQAGLWQHLKNSPSPVEIIGDDGMSSYHVETPSRKWIVAVDRESAHVEYAAWEVKLCNISVSSLEPIQVKAVCSRIPTKGTTLRTFKKLNEANEYAGVCFYEQKIRAEDSKRLNGLSLSDYKVLAQERESSIRDANSEYRSFHMFGVFDAESALLVWVQPCVLTG